MYTFLSRSIIPIVASVALLAPACSWAQQGDLLARIKDAKQLTVATEARYAPFEYVDAGKIVGYDIDLMNHVLGKALPGVKLKASDLPFQGLLPGLDARRFDMILAAVTVNKDRADHFAFTLPVADATIGVLLRANEAGSVKSTGDLNGKIAGAQIGSVQTQALTALDKTLKSSGGEGLKQIKQYVSYDEAYGDLAAGRIDVVAQSLANIGPLMKSRPGVFAVMPQTIGPKSYFAWVMRKDSDSGALLRVISDGIAEANRDGTMKKLQLKWFGTTMDVPADALPVPSM
ncbi:transporter substrate-binding domain-containing protein [Paraburkholderia tropica]|uniref:transporter substrate-binding domain-containing protein n=1 Tax=Paraburkholderia tropica TaxID=92647 RepID=UPI002ABE3C03|nr:transporter substrate-binding domain-containing protein [Paraburkholderia tropica]